MKTILFLAAALTACGPLEVDETSSAISDALQIYMSPTGSDANDGLASGQVAPSTGPVRTLARVQQVIQARGLSRDVEVRIAYGVYAGQAVKWTVTSPTHSITFMPSDYQVGMGLGDIHGRPVFTGDAGLGYTDDWFFELKVRDGHATNLHFHYLQIEKYVPGGISFHGNSDKSETGWNGYNEVTGCLFYRIGNKSLGIPSYGYGAVDLVNSRYNSITHNDFQYIRNDAPDESHIHAVYVAHGSHHNDVSQNRYYKINGDPIKVRDYSNFNVFDGTDVARDYTLTGRTAFFQDWYCLTGVTTSSTCTKQECPSYENRFRYNELVCAHDGTNDIATFAFFPPNRDYRPSWCPSPEAGWTRLHTVSNSKHCP